ncbi:hypothetical protein [Microvirga sp. M2]|uniref:hypothetical protein n=1 Tax=Microvirga sp. M2 TaxID=3073270 RepID=UPI0039C480CF
MVNQRSRLSCHTGNVEDEDRQPQLRVPVIPTLVGALALVNIVATILALIE